MTKTKLISKNGELKLGEIQLKQDINQLKTAAMEKSFLIAQFQKMLFGAKSERFVKDAVNQENPSNLFI